MLVFLRPISPNYNALFLFIRHRRQLGYTFVYVHCTKSIQLLRIGLQDTAATSAEVLEWWWWWSDFVRIFGIASSLRHDFADVRPTAHTNSGKIDQRSTR